MAKYNHFNKYKGRHREWLVRQLLNQYGLVCGICHEPIESIKLITIDHIIPLSRGGSYELKNLTLAHWECNHAKDNLTQEEFEALQSGDI